MILLGGPESLFKHIGLKKVVRIQKGEVFAHGMAQAVVARGAGARIFLADHLDAWILCGQPLQNGGRIIRRAIVDAQNLDILKGLGSHGMQALFQMPLRIVSVLLEIGMQKRTADVIPLIFSGKETSAVTCDAKGLLLTSIKY